VRCSTLFAREYSDVPSQHGLSLNMKRNTRRGFVSTLICDSLRADLCECVDEVRCGGMWPWSKSVNNHTTAIFRQINKDNRWTHHDALEFPDGQIVVAGAPHNGIKA
jgi:hypothetical protein